MDKSFAAIIVLIVLAIAAFIYNVKQFSQACSDAGGKMVYNGRFYDCIIAKTDQLKTTK